MFRAAIVPLVALATSVLAQSAAYGQCGGTGWSGASTCVSGYTCVVQNSYYSQCVPGSASGTSTTGKTTTSVSTHSTTSTPTSTSASSSATAQCGQWDSTAAGTYSLNNDQWGISGASGSQCSSLLSVSGNTVSWSTTWTWTGGSGVKTFADIQANSNLNLQLSEITSIPSTWDWSYDESGTIVADVAYDLFTSESAGGSNANEIMIWLANINAGPIASSYSSSGAPVPTVSDITIDGTVWDLYTGSNGSNAVYSFLPASGSDITSFSGDLNAFLKYLTSEGYFSTSQYLITAQAGTEATSGSATLTTTSYSLVING